MKVLLVEPPFERFQEIKRGFFPLGIASIGAYLQRAGHEVMVYDAELGDETSITSYSKATQSYEKFLQGLRNPSHPVWQEVESVIKDFAPQVLGLSCPTVKYESALIIASLAKKLFPQVVVVLGSYHPSAMPDQVLANPQVDYVVRGEGELTMTELLANLGQDLKNIPGLSYKTANGELVHNSQRQLIADLNDLPYPGRELIRNNASYHSEDMGLLMGSRGCPFSCTYCASNNMWHRRVRYRSVDNIIAEIKHVQETFGTQQFSFEDDSFTTNPKLIAEFCNRLKTEGIHISWSAITRINLLTGDMLKQMQGAGCNHLRVGIESGSAKILKDTHKGLTLEDMRRGAKLLHEQGIYWSAYFMVGLPTETEEDIQDTINFLQEIKPDYATLSIFTPYPGTAIFEELLNSGKVSENMDWSRFSHASPYNNFAFQIEQERFAQLVEQAAQVVDNHNSNLLRLFKRAKSKGSIYLQKPGELRKDLQNYLAWKKQ